MTDTQRNALKIVIEAVVSSASNGYTVKVDDIVTVIEGIIEKEKETQFVPGLYPNDYKTLKPCPPGLGNIPQPYPGMENPKLWDQIVYTYNSTSTTNDDIQKICEKNPIKPIEPNESITWEDNEF